MIDIDTLLSLPERFQSAFQQADVDVRSSRF